MLGYEESYTQPTYSIILDVVRGVSEKKGGETIQQTRGRGDAGTRRIEIPHKISLTLVRASCSRLT
ncbi:MAG: hypothetical protein F6K47_32770 [Symploca sp. SIO2E6]|nr:hypothetical protein [Symploca sp. SIO2E6]